MTVGMRPPRTFMAGALCAAVVLTAAGCGFGGPSPPSASVGGAPVAAKRGGTLTMLFEGDVDSIDPGRTRQPPGLMVAYATQRPLYSWEPDDPEHPVADLASGPPAITPDGCTVTVHIRSGVRFSPPLARTVTARDVAYAIERGFFDTVDSPTARAYFGDVRGAKAGVRPGTTVPGITTPGAGTIVFHLRPRRGGACDTGTLVDGLALPVTAPVPEEYAAPLDDERPSTYGTHQVATGPYMVATDASGRLAGYQPDAGIRLVRNPRWDASTDYKPAYLDEVDVVEGNVDTAAASREVLGGQDIASGALSPPAVVVRQALRDRPSQVARIAGAGIGWIAMNPRIRPFDDVDVRRAVVAGFDREAMWVAGGGATLAEMPTHLLRPGAAGFDRAGGTKGPGVDVMSDPAGDRALSAAYFRKAGYRAGRYTGGGRLLMAGAVGPAAQVAIESFARMGFKVRLVAASRATDSCDGPRVALCVIDHPLEPREGLGAEIPPLGNPRLDAALRRAAELVRPGQRARASARADVMATNLAPVIPYAWYRQPVLRSADVIGVPNRFDGLWDLSFTSVR